MKKITTFLFFVLLSLLIAYNYFTFSVETFETNYTNEILDIINNKRSINEIDKLELNQNLNELAKNIADKKVNKDIISNFNLFEVLKENNVEYKCAGINVTYTSSIKDIENKYEEESTEKNNILNKEYKTIGIYVNEYECNKYIVIQVFIG